MCCVLRQIELSFCHFTVMVRVCRVMVMVNVRVRIIVQVGMPIPEYGYKQGACTAKDGKNGYGLCIMYTKRIMYHLELHDGS